LLDAVVAKSVSDLLLSVRRRLSCQILLISLAVFCLGVIVGDV
jgi:hypothetical protein